MINFLYLKLHKRRKCKKLLETSNKYLDYNDTLIKQLEKEIENNKKQAQQFITSIVKAQVNEEVREQTETSSVNLV